MNIEYTETQQNQGFGGATLSENPSAAGGAYPRPEAHSADPEAAYLYNFIMKPHQEEISPTAISLLDYTLPFTNITKFTSKDKDINITFTQLYNRFTFNDDYIYYKFTFCNNINTILKELIISNVDIIKLIENISYSIETNQDINFYISGINNSSNIMNISYVDFINNTDIVYKLTIFEYNNEYMKPILSFNLYNEDISIFYDILYSLVFPIE